jgi:hypothetical protein
MLAVISVLCGVGLVVAFIGTLIQSPTLHSYGVPQDCQPPIIWASMMAAFGLG